jgi:ferric-dicitrate binding protein FerR (iron transport regulator)
MDKKQLPPATLKAVLNKYVQGTATPEEIRQVEQWYASFTEEDILQDPREKERLRQEILSGVIQHIQIQAPPHRRNTVWWSAAAVVLVAVAIAGLYNNNRKKQPTVAAQHISTPAGERKQITLSDGTVIHLNAATELTIPGDFGSAERRIMLSGEAFFDVAPDPARPFIIQSGNLNTTVLGTSFNIRAYKGQQEYDIAVITGRVKVTDAQTNRSIADSLTANAQLAYDLLSKEAVINHLPEGMAGAWRRNIFYFNNSTLAEIGEELQRQYNIPVIVTGAGKNSGHYKISFSREPLSEVLKVLAGLTGITYQIEPDKVLIHIKK